MGGFFGSSGGADWALAGSWAYSENVANVDFASLDGYSELLVIARDITLSSSGVRHVQVSVDNGSTFYAASGDYKVLTTAGGDSNINYISGHLTASTAARSLSCHILASNVSGIPKVGRSTDRGDVIMFTASTLPINAIRVKTDAGNFTAGNIYILGK